MNSDTPVNHAPEMAEPTAGSVPAPVWLFVLLAVLFYGGLEYLDRHAGGFNAMVYEPNLSYKAVEDLQPKSEGGEMIAKGKLVFSTACMACHQATGLGTPGQFPPLAGSEWVQAEGPNRIIRLVLNGIMGPITVSGQSFNGVMPPWKDTLKDEDIAAAITYIRNSWGNKGSPVTPEQVKKIRDQVKDRAAPWTPEELQALSDK